jgi:hypothetical protein
MCCEIPLNLCFEQGTIDRFHVYRDSKKCMQIVKLDSQDIKKTKEKDDGTFLLQFAASEKQIGYVDEKFCRYDVCRYRITRHLKLY